MKQVNVGMIGSGFAANLHTESYKRVCGVEPVMKALSSIAPNAAEFAAQYGFEKLYPDYEDLLKDPEIDVIDIITPPVLHVDMIVKALQAGKHVICEKPLTGYFGESDGTQLVGSTPKRKMYEKVLQLLETLEDVVRSSGKHFMYCENFCYTPAVQKTAEIVRAKRSKILYMRAEEAHSGSHAPHAAYWRMNGGGSFIRQGCHPLTAALYLKQEEARARGEKISVTSVMADVGVTAAALSEAERKHIAARPVDVEDHACVLLSFSDGTKATISAGDYVLGGIRNIVEVFTNEGTYINNIAPNTHLLAYDVEETGLDNVYFTEKCETKTGWQPIFIDENYARGYISELQDFMECVALNREPLCGFDLAALTSKVTYGAYLSAEEGIRVTF